MKILLLRPNDFMFTEINGSSNPYNIEIYPFSLAVISAYLKKANASIEVIATDGMRYPHDSTGWLEDIISETKPDVIIAIVNIITLHLWSKRIANAKNEIPFKLIGLIHLPFEIDCIENYPVFDVIIYREWIRSVADVIKSLQAKDDLHRVKGIYIKKNNVGYYTGKPDHLSLQEYPYPDYDLFNINQYKIFPLFWTDGCKYKCKYCYFGIYPETGWESKQICNIVQEIEELTARDMKSISIEIIDHEFTLDYNFAISVLKRISSLNLNLSILANTRVNSVTKELVGTAERAGVTTFGIGIESGVQKVLDYNNKGMTLEQIRRAVKVISQSTIFLQAYIQVGLLGETEKDFLETIRFTCQELPIKKIALGISIPYPGTLMGKELLEKGWMKERLSISNLIWLYKNIYGYEFLQLSSCEQPMWRTSEDITLLNVIDLYRENKGKLLDNQYKTSLLTKIRRKIIKY